MNLLYDIATNPTQSLAKFDPFFLFRFFYQMFKNFWSDVGEDICRFRRLLSYMFDIQLGLFFFVMDKIVPDFSVTVAKAVAPFIFYALTIVNFVYDKMVLFSNAIKQKLMDVAGDFCNRIYTLISVSLTLCVYFLSNSLDELKNPTNIPFDMVNFCLGFVGLTSPSEGVKLIFEWFAAYRDVLCPIFKRKYTGAYLQKLQQS